MSRDLFSFFLQSIDKYKLCSKSYKTIYFFIISAIEFLQFKIGFFINCNFSGSSKLKTDVTKNERNSIYHFCHLTVNHSLVIIAYFKYIYTVSIIFYIENNLNVQIMFRIQYYFLAH